MRSTRFFRALLRLLPFEIREAHGRDMEQAFRDGYRERGRGFWLSVVLDILRIAPRQHAEALAQDLRYAARTFRGAPAFSLTAILTIGLAIGAVTTVFAVIDAVILRPLPFSRPQEVGIVWAVDPESRRTWLSMPELDDVRERVPALQTVAGVTDMRLALTGAGDPEELSAAGVSGTFASVLGITPQTGRLLEPADDVRGAPLVAILSDGLWRRRFGARQDIVGSTIRLDGRAYAVAGVMPRGFVLPPPSSVFPAAVDVWVALTPHVTGGRDIRILHVLGRTKAGATIATAREQAVAAGRVVSTAHPEYRGRAWSFEVVQLQNDLARTIRPALLVLFGIVALVLFIAVANVAALLLSRGTARQQEVSIRVALGASAARLVRQLVTEALLLGALGGLLGVVLAKAAITLTHQPPLSSIPRFDEVTLDWRVTLFAFLVALSAMVMVSLAPLVVLRGTSAQKSLRARDRSHGAIRAGRMLAAGEIALACVVLIMAIVLTRGFAALWTTDPGFRTERVLSFRVSLPPKYAAAPQVTAFFDRALERLAVLPGVQNAAAVTQLPLSGASLGSTFLLGAGDAPRVDADLRGVSHSYFSTLDVRVVEGRGFQAADNATSPWVAIVDEPFARRAWPNESALGKKIRWFRAPDRELEVVGVVRSVRHRGFEAPPRETVYRPYAQYPRWTMFLALRTSNDPADLTAAAQAAIRSLDPDQPLADVVSMDTLASRSLAQPAFGAVLSSTLAAIALGLTMVGMYGLFAFAVSKRTREVGVRLALGATPRQIVSLILRDGLRLTASGLLIGAPLAWLAATAIERRLALPVAIDLPTVAVAMTIVLATTAIACWLPSRRASRVSPAEPLRSS